VKCRGDAEEEKEKNLKNFFLFCVLRSQHNREEKEKVKFMEERKKGTTKIGKFMEIV
jgi:hypothetical protein